MSKRSTPTRWAVVSALGIAVAQCGSDDSFNLDCSPTTPSVGQRVALSLDYDIESQSDPFTWSDSIGLGTFEQATIPAMDTSGMVTNGFTPQSAGNTTIEVRRGGDVVASCVLQVSALATFDVSVSVVGNGTVTFDTEDCRTACQRPIADGTMLEFVATADEGWRFDSWSGACASSTDSTVTLTIDEATSCEATFVEVSSPGPDEILIAAGSFARGCVVEAAPNPECEETQTTICLASETRGDLETHQVMLSSFFIDRTEVTVAQYRVCVEAGDCTAPDVGDGCNYQESNREQHPVNCVTWDQAKTYCESRGQRLPTEAEWEMAARGTEDTRKFPWGDDCPTCSRGNYRSTVDGRCSPAPGGTLPVGTSTAGAATSGALDMAGNVSEWVQDWFDGTYYTDGPTTDPQGPADGMQRVRRGGSWSTTSNMAQVFRRDMAAPDSPDRQNGFRCAR